MNEPEAINLADDIEFVDAITDEALEAAGGAAGLGPALTVAFCTGQAECPF